jgi:muramoyltetrapeptide carboxypeptidase
VRRFRGAEVAWIQAFLIRMDRHHAGMQGYYSLVRPKPLGVGATIGIATPSCPAHVVLRDLYLHGVELLRESGFRVIEGSLTKRTTAQGYRSGTARERAEELMALFLDPTVDGIMTTIGGSNSSSLIPYLDFAVIAAHPKVFCGYSDITSLHLALMRRSRLGTFYGPAVAPSFGKPARDAAETVSSFLDAVRQHQTGQRQLQPPKRWSRQFIDARQPGYRDVQREYASNLGWTTWRHGTAEGPVIVCNLNTLMTTAGTIDFPDVDGAILILEEESAPLSREERHLTQLKRMGVFSRIAGLAIGKAERLDREGAPFDLPDLLAEVLDGEPGFPVLLDVDCGHTTPQITIPQGVMVRLDALGETGSIILQEPGISA